MAETEGQISMSVLQAKIIEGITQIHNSINEK